MIQLRNAARLLPCFLLSALALGQAPDSLDHVERLFERERWEEAAQACEAALESDPENAYGWFYLGYARHNGGDLRGAIEAGRRSSEFPVVRGISFYNLACAYSVLDELDAAGECLDQALAAGYLDLDHMLTDPELANLFARRPLDLAPAQDYTTLRGRNGVEIPYLVQQPERFEAGREVSIAIAFGPGGGGKLATDWSIGTLWNASPAAEDWIVVHVVAPERGWRNHPAHHALEDLFKQLREDYEVRGNRFHLFGYGAGASNAALYGGMSRAYTASLTLAATDQLPVWDASDFRRRSSIPTHVVHTSESEHQRERAGNLATGLTRAGGAVQVTVVDDGPLLRKTRAGGGFLADIQVAAALASSN